MHFSHCCTAASVLLPERGLSYTKHRELTWLWLDICAAPPVTIQSHPSNFRVMLRPYSGHRQRRNWSGLQEESNIEKHPNNSCRGTYLEFAGWVFRAPYGKGRFQSDRVCASRVDSLEDPRSHKMRKRCSRFLSEKRGPPPAQARHVHPLPGQSEQGRLQKTHAPERGPNRYIQVKECSPCL